jgi:hypothetical protein
MSKSDLIEDLQSRIALLEKHVTEQDVEMYQLSKRIDSLVKVAKEQKATSRRGRIQLAERGRHACRRKTAALLSHMHSQGGL